MRLSVRRILVTSALSLAMVGVGAGIAAAVTTSKSGTSVARMTIHTQDAAATFSGTTWTTVGSTSIVATANNHVLVRFSAESACAGAAGNWCSVRILIDGVEADPVAGTDFAFDEAESGSSWESHSMERARTVTFSGGHIVTVQAYTPSAAVTHRLDDWTITVTAINP